MYVTGEKQAERVEKIVDIITDGIEDDGGMVTYDIGIHTPRNEVATINLEIEAAVTEEKVTRALELLEETRHDY